MSTVLSFWTTFRLFRTKKQKARFMWNLAAPAMDRALCDNAGVDIHEDSVNALLPALEQTGFACEIRVSGMECIRPRGFGVGLLNPPFSIHLENPVLEPLPCTG